MTTVQHHPANVSGTDYFVGDIHGCYSQLMQALDEIGFDSVRDRLFSVGDIIDRGPENEACLTLLDKPWFYSVQGNHEAMMAATIFDRDDLSAGMWLSGGGDWWLAVADQSRLLPYMEALAQRPLVIRVAGVAVLHAECYGDIQALETNQLSPDTRERLLWGRTRIGSEDTTPVTGVDAVVVGHTPTWEAPVVLGNTIYLDNGFWHRNALPIILSGEAIKHRVNAPI